jgi:hypothetical protein
MKRPRAGCPGGALAAFGDEAPGLTRKPSADLGPNLMGLRCLLHLISTGGVIWSRRRAWLSPPLIPAQAGIQNLPLSLPGPRWSLPPTTIGGGGERRKIAIPLALSH